MRCVAIVIIALAASSLAVEAVASEVVSASGGPKNQENRDFSRFPGLKSADFSAFNSSNQHVTGQTGRRNNREFCRWNRECRGRIRGSSPSNREAGRRAYPSQPTMDSTAKLRADQGRKYWLRRTLPTSAVSPHG